MSSHSNVAEIIVETLVEAGARRCYGVVGDTINHFKFEHSVANHPIMLQLGRAVQVAYKLNFVWDLQQQASYQPSTT